MKQQCTFKIVDSEERCPNWGVPEEGFDFYACADCCAKLEIMIEALYDIERASKN